MCYYAEIPPTNALLEKRLKRKLFSKKENNQIEIWSGFDHPKVPVIMSDLKDSIALIRWGLIPQWANKTNAKEIWNSTLNAKIETLEEKPSFRDCVDNRCLVLVSGFFEWQHLGKQKIKYKISLKDKDVFALAGIFSVWKIPDSDDAYLRTFAIITTEANDMMKVIHNTKQRMPLIIEENDYDNYLNSSINIHTFNKEFDSSKMIAEAC